jgi:hypothetical protein
MRIQEAKNIRIRNAVLKSHLTVLYPSFCNFLPCLQFTCCSEPVTFAPRRIKEPNHDICIKGDVIEVKSFLSVLRKVLAGGEVALAGSVSNIS